MDNYKPKGNVLQKIISVLDYKLYYMQNKNEQNPYCSVTGKIQTGTCKMTTEEKAGKIKVGNTLFNTAMSTSGHCNSRKICTDVI